MPEPLLLVVVVIPCCCWLWPPPLPPLPMPIIIVAGDGVVVGPAAFTTTLELQSVQQTIGGIGGGACW